MPLRWYAIRSVYEHEREDDGTGVFCERVLLFHASNAQSALEQAERESTRYLELNSQFQRIGELTIFATRESGLPVDGAEVWCMLYRDKRSGSDFYEHHYKQLELPLDED